MRTARLLVLGIVLVLGGCSVADGRSGDDGSSAEDAPVAVEARAGRIDERLARTPGDAPPPGPAATSSGASEQDGAASSGAASREPGADTGARPDWLGTRELPRGPDGFGEAGATPPELVDRRLPPPASHLAPPESDDFEASIAQVDDEVAARSTWRPECPVGLDELRYLTVTFWGFDERPHTGELLVHASAAEDVVGVFEALYEARFPIEEMRIVRPDELDAPPTGDGNNTTAFVCRPGVGGAAWSEHAFGLGIDVNPFHNPYVRGELVLPELATAYLERDEHREGMIRRGGVVTEAFADIGWGWGGTWRSSKDWMHFSANGR